MQGTPDEYKRDKKKHWKAEEKRGPVSPKWAEELDSDI